MFEFWSAALLLALLVLAICLRMMRQSGEKPSELPEIALYRAELAQLDADIKTGKINAGAAETLRAELSRRLLRADAARGDAQFATGLPPAVILAVLAIALTGAVLIYFNLGRPGAADMPIAGRFAAADQLRANRPTQAVLEADFAVPDVPLDASYVELVADLRAALADRPDDLQGYRLLTTAEARMGNLPAAAAAQARVVGIQGDAAPIGELSTLHELMIAAAGGQISPETETVLRRILTADPQNKLARFRLGDLHRQTGRPDLTFRLWSQLLEEGPELAPYIPEIRAEIETLALYAGAGRYAPPPVRGPDAADIAAAEGLSDADRRAMIENMVTGLSDRLATDGGTAQEWAQLIQAYGVLGQTDRAAAIWAEAEHKFDADSPGGQAIRAAAAAAGVLN